MGGNCQDHVHSNVFFLGCNHHCLSCKHRVSYVLVKIDVDFMFNGITNKTMIDDGTEIVCFFATSFVIGLFFIPSLV